MDQLYRTYTWLSASAGSSWTFSPTKLAPSTETSLMILPDDVLRMIIDELVYVECLTCRQHLEINPGLGLSLASVNRRMRQLASFITVHDIFLQVSSDLLPHLRYLETSYLVRRFTRRIRITQTRTIANKTLKRLMAVLRTCERLEHLTLDISEELIDDYTLCLSSPATNLNITSLTIPPTAGQLVDCCPRLRSLTPTLPGFPSGFTLYCAAGVLGRQLTAFSMPIGWTLSDLEHMVKNLPHLQKLSCAAGSNEYALRIYDTLLPLQGLKVLVLGQLTGILDNNFASVRLGARSLRENARLRKERLALTNNCQDYYGRLFFPAFKNLEVLWFGDEFRGQVTRSEHGGCDIDWQYIRRWTSSVSAMIDLTQAPNYSPARRM